MSGYHGNRLGDIVHCFPAHEVGEAESSDAGSGEWQRE